MQVKGCRKSDAAFHGDEVCAVLSLPEVTLGQGLNVTVIVYPHLGMQLYLQHLAQAHIMPLWKVGREVDNACLKRGQARYANSNAQQVVFREVKRGQQLLKGRD